MDAVCAFRVASLSRTSLPLWHSRDNYPRTQASQVVTADAHDETRRELQGHQECRPAMTVSQSVSNYGCRVKKIDPVTQS